MAEKILQTRLLMKVDTLENWGKSTLKLKKGELAFATVAASAGTGLEDPVVMVKIGTEEEKTFAELPWAFHAKAADVLTACKDETALRTFINGVITDAGVATDAALKTLSTQVTTNKTDIATLKGLIGDESVAVQIQNKIDSLNLGTTYEKVGEAKKLVDALAEGQVATNAGDIATLKADLNTAETGLKAKVAALEAASATHATTTALEAAVGALEGVDAGFETRIAAVEAKFGNGEGNVEAQIAAAKSAAITEAVAQAEAKDVVRIAEAKKYTDDEIAELDLANTYAAKTHGHEMAEVNGLVDAIADAKKAGTDAQTSISTLVGDKTVSVQIDEVVNPVKTRVKTIEDDYLKAADKTELEGKIKVNTDAIAAIKEDVDAFFLDADMTENAKDTLKEIQAYMNSDASAASEMAASIKQNADAIKAITDDYLKAADKTELTGAINGNAAAIEALEGELDAEGTGLKARMTAVEGKATANATAIETANGEIAKKAAQTDLDTLAGRVTTAEGDIDALEGRMTTVEGKASANETAIGVLQTKVGDKTVATQIDEAITAKNLGQYATTTALNGAVETINGNIAKKADKTTVEGIDGRLTTAEGKITAVEGAVATKAEQSDLTALAGRVTTAEGEIDTLQADIVKKANDADLKAVAKSGLIDDLTLGEGTVLIFDCGGADVE